MGHDTDIAVVGGTGTIGREVARALAAAGHPVRVVSRRSPAAGVLPPGTRHVQADVTDPASLRSALAGAAVVVDAVNSTDQRRAERLLPQGTRALVAAAAAEGSRHLVLVSIVGCDRVGLGYYRGKVAQESELASGPLPWSVLRATQLHPLVAGLLSAAARWRIVPMARMPLQPVDPAEVGEAVARVAAGTPLLGRVSLAGPEIRPLAELATAWQSATGARGLRVPVPLPGRVGGALRGGGLVDASAPRARNTFADWLTAAAAA